MALKHYNPTTPSTRALILVDKSSLHKGSPVKALTEGKRKTGGRNNKGHVTSRGIAGGHKQRYRIIDFKRRTWDVEATVERLEYDPNRTAFIALVKYPDDSVAYILAPQRLAVGDKIIAAKKTDVKPGNAMELGQLLIVVGERAGFDARQPVSDRAAQQTAVFLDTLVGRQGAEFVHQ